VSTAFACVCGAVRRVEVGFSCSFMNDLDRILVDGYVPSDSKRFFPAWLTLPGVGSDFFSGSVDDVVRARLRTMGIQEHKFVFETGEEAHTPRESVVFFSQSLAIV